MRTPRQHTINGVLIRGFPPVLQEGDYEWGEAEEGGGVRVGGHITERDGVLVLEGFIGDRLVTANIAAVNNSIHIFTQV